MKKYGFFDFLGIFKCVYKSVKIVWSRFVEFIGRKVCISRRGNSWYVM